MTDRQQIPVLVLGGGCGGVAAALQVARTGVEVILVTPGIWLGGMLSAGGVSAPDGNELAAWQTGLWGALLRQLRLDLDEGLDQNWVSCFGFPPAAAEAVLQRWVQDEPLLHWLPSTPVAALKQQGDRLLSAVLDGPDGPLEVAFDLLVDGSELADSLALAALPHRQGWEPRELWNEPSAPTAQRLASDPFFAHQPLQSPTWVLTARWEGPWHPVQRTDKTPQPPFSGCLQRFDLERLLSYGRLPGGLLMLNWPLDGNDWHEDPSACLSSSQQRARHQLRAMADHSRRFLAALQDLSGPQLKDSQAYPGGSLALQPYWRESRRLIGQTTVNELMLLPGFPGDDASTAVAVGNYANDHHYPGEDWPLKPKQHVWGGRSTGTPFTIPLAALHGSDAANLLLAEKGFSVSHIANGATRLGPLLLQIGQAAGATAAICHQKPCLPAELPARAVQAVLIRDNKAPVAVAACADLAWHDPNWQVVQEQLIDGSIPSIQPAVAPPEPGEEFVAMEIAIDSDDAWFGVDPNGQRWPLITLEPAVMSSLPLAHGKRQTLVGKPNPWGPWWRINRVLP